MLRRWGWASLARYKVKNWTQDFENSVALSQCATIHEGYPGACKFKLSTEQISRCPLCYTLIFAISALYLLVHSLLDFSLKNPSSRRLVKIRNFQYVCGIDPVIGPSSHYLVSIGIEFVYRHLEVSSASSPVKVVRYCHTLLYVPE